VWHRVVLLWCGVALHWCLCGSLCSCKLLFVVVLLCCHFVLLCCVVVLCCYFVLLCCVVVDAVQLACVCARGPQPQLHRVTRDFTAREFLVSLIGKTFRSIAKQDLLQVRDVCDV